VFGPSTKAEIFHEPNYMRGVGLVKADIYANASLRSPVVGTGPDSPSRGQRKSACKTLDMVRASQRVARDGRRDARRDHARAQGGGAMRMPA
jgi:hypothetical protein